MVSSSRMLRCSRFLLVACLFVASQPAAGAASGGSEVLLVRRVGGADRYETAVQTALQRQIDQCSIEGGGQDCLAEPISGSYTLVRGDSFADALAAASTAIRPILTTPQDALPQQAFRPLQDRLTQEARIIGDTDVISAQVEQALVPTYARFSFRLAGPTRYDTAVEVARQHHEEWNLGVVSFIEVVIVNGDRWPDGLTAAALLSTPQRVVLPVQRDVIPGVVAEYLSEGVVDERTILTVVGGEAVVSDTVVRELEEMTGQPVRRLGGATRFETARAVADVYYDERLADDVAGQPNERKGVILVRPDTFADAIAAPNLIHVRGAPILLAAGQEELGEENAAWLRTNGPQISSITALGTADVLGDVVLDDAARAVCDTRPSC